MQRKSKLSKKQQALVAEWMPLARMLARYFVSRRAGWQRSLLVEDLEAEGYLAITRAARTYQRSRLPYPRAYFARACLNAMCRSIKKMLRQPGEWKIALAEAEQLTSLAEDPDWLRMAVDDMGEESKICEDRFINGMTLRQISEAHGVSLRAASVRSRALARTLATRLEIQLGQPGRIASNRPAESSPGDSAAREAS
jgi:hypothetical protein